MGTVAQFREKHRDRRRKERRSGGLATAATFAVGVVVGLLVMSEKDAVLPLLTSVSQSFAALATCNIKGNVSYNTGERIFHVPGQKFYHQTVISPSRGERWFCTENEAWAAGWRRARR
ncbi:hypothetical protein GGD81_001990 [Rhodobium orientis]|uniref:Succinoglycan biosynthesis protein exoi n=1 Tax=Rhodobium orientis TaxID=34017 RepID=A0A327JUZ2_9HYPH|nr:succinoglycan biosynthesis protein exoi [Rhodobium orientis]MBB4302952.1 hypothetical protein [Rhodobium orientis]MBK5949513.1 hypothetical protein [Rhodobium orientis]RAI29304.1 hypothetical protein CH339_03190 [Rhodobium orientis]